MSDEKKNDNYIRANISEIKRDVEKLNEQASNIDKNLIAYKVAFDQHLEQDERMYQEFKRMNDLLFENTMSLKEHMHRTSLLEQTMLKMDERLAPIEVERIKKQAVGAFIKEKVYLSGKVLAAITAAIGLYKAIHMMIH